MFNLYNEGVITSGVTKDVVSDPLSGVCVVPSHHIHIAAMNMQKLTWRKKSQQETEIILVFKKVYTHILWHLILTKLRILKKKCEHYSVTYIQQPILLQILHYQKQLFPHIHIKW